MIHGDVPPFGQYGQLRLYLLFLILPSVDFVQTFQADFRILQLAGETDERTYRCIQLADDVGERHHHP